MKQASFDLFAADDEAEPATFPAADAVAELREIAASSYDGVDVIAFVRSLRDEDEVDPTIEEPDPDPGANSPKQDVDPEPSQLPQDAPKQQDRCIDTLTPTTPLRGSSETWTTTVAYFFGGRP